MSGGLLSTVKHHNKTGKFQIEKCHGTTIKEGRELRKTALLK